jgi:hypothetical protein
MGDLDFLWQYVGACASGALRFAECGPVWQVAVIAILLLAAVGALVVLRLRASR